MTGSPSTLSLFKPQELRRKAHDILQRLSGGELPSIRVVPEKMDGALLSVLETTRETYPDFQIPPYGVWRDFEFGGLDRWAALATARDFETAEEMLASAADLAVVTAFMKTRHPSDWVFEESMSGVSATGSRASALAAFQMFAAGSFSSDMSDPYRVDAATLIRFDLEELASALQWDIVRDKALLVEMQRYLKRLGEALSLRPDLFCEGDATRPGLLAVKRAGDSEGVVDAERLLDNLLETLAPVWDGGAVSGDVSLGDSFALLRPEKAAETGGSDDIVPFHTAAQEMVYSMVEPFAWAGFEVAGLDLLTAPADAAHVALFVETGVLEILPAEAVEDGETSIDRTVALRAAAIALSDRLADRLREELEASAEQLPLTCILEGGTARAGARLLEQSAEKGKNLGQYLDPGDVFWLPFGQ
ncbi:DUF1688 family protein [Rhodobacterales bacterium]|nr:DUF1688 family protein [Rhodobacterales bacterium]